MRFKSTDIRIITAMLCSSTIAFQILYEKYIYASFCLMDPYDIWIGGRREIQRSPVVTLIDQWFHKGPVTRRFDAFFAVSPKKICGTNCRVSFSRDSSHGVTVMRRIISSCFHNLIYHNGDDNNRKSIIWPHLLFSIILLYWPHVIYFRTEKID